MATIGDVAREAGVSRSTVSSVLTGRKPVTPATREKIERAIAKLSFTVNSGARALATSRTMTLGLVFSFQESKFVSSASTYVVALAEEARESGYGLMLLTGENGVSEVERILAGKSVDGLIVMELIEDDPRLDAIRKGGVPAALIGMPEDTAGVDAVDLDYVAAGRLAVDNVLSQGARSLAIVGWPEPMYERRATYATRFLRGATDRARDVGLRQKVFKCDVDRASIQHCLLSILRDGGFDSLVVHNDAILPVLGTLLVREHAEDWSVTGLCSRANAQEHWFPFDAVDTMPLESARLAVQMVTGRLGGSAGTPLSIREGLQGAGEYRRVLLQPTIVPGVSSTL